MYLIFEDYTNAMETPRSEILNMDRFMRIRIGRKRIRFYYSTFGYIFVERSKYNLSVLNNFLKVKKNE